jgi:hypothetical protein
MMCCRARLPHSHRNPATGPARSTGPVGDPKVVPSGIDDPEVPQAPRAIAEILLKRPPSRHDQVTFTSDIVNLKYQLHPRRRQPRREGGRHGPSCCAHPHGATLHRYVRARVMALILRHAEAQYSSVKVDGGIKVGRKDPNRSVISIPGSSQIRTFPPLPLERYEMPGNL